MFKFEEIESVDNPIPVLRCTSSYIDLLSLNLDLSILSHETRTMSYDDMTHDLLSEFRTDRNPVTLFKLAERVQNIDPKKATHIWIRAYYELKKKQDDSEARKYLRYLMSYMWKSFFGEALNVECELHMDYFFDPLFIVNEVLPQIIELDDEGGTSRYTREAYFALAYCYAFGIVVNKDLVKAKEYIDKGILCYTKCYEDELSSYIETGNAAYSFIFTANNLKLLSDYFSCHKHGSISFELPFGRDTEIFFRFAIKNEYAHDYLRKIISYHCYQEPEFLNNIKKKWNLSKDEIRLLDEFAKYKINDKNEISIVKLPSSDGEYVFRKIEKVETKNCDFNHLTSDSAFCIEKGNDVLAYCKLNSSTDFDGMEYYLSISYSKDVDESTKDSINKTIFEKIRHGEFVIKELTSTLRHVSKVFRPRFAVLEKSCSGFNEESIYGGDVVFTLTYYSLNRYDINDEDELVYEF